MKKIFSLILTFAMILSLLILSAITASAASDGDWNVYTAKGQYAKEDSSEMKPIPGYEYTEDGLHMIPADWSTSTPCGIFQTKEQIDLRQGVYMEVRIDNFTYEGDKWFGFNIWEEKIDEFPYGEDKSALGFEALIRVNDDKTMSSVQFNEHTTVGTSTQSELFGASSAKNDFDENGCPIFTLQITWNETDGYDMILNGMSVGSARNGAITRFFDGEDNDGKAYVSFSLQNSIRGGTVECTVLKFGTSPDQYSVPKGEDSAASIDNKIVIADIADAGTVPDGEPAVLITGDVSGSDLLMDPKSTNNSTVTVKDDFSINVAATGNWASISLSVDYDRSYDIKDFPILMIVTRNMCICTWHGGFPECACEEMLSLLAMTGDAISESEGYRVCAQSPEGNADTDEDGNLYSYYISDWSSLSGRINGLRIDLYGLKYDAEGRNSFDICRVAFFRNQDEAKEYYNDYLAEIGLIEDGYDETETEAHTAEKTEMPTLEETEQPAVEATEASTTEPIEVPTVEENEAPTAESTDTPMVEETDAPTSEETEERTVEKTESPATEETAGSLSTDVSESELPTDPAATGKSENAPASESPAVADDTNATGSGCGGTIGFGTLTVISSAIVGLSEFRRRMKNK